MQADDEVIEAAKKAHAHEFILQTELQYDSLVGERGVKLIRRAKAAHRDRARHP